MYILCIFVIFQVILHKKNHPPENTENQTRKQDCPQPLHWPWPRTKDTPFELLHLSKDLGLMLTRYLKE